MEYWDLYDEHHKCTGETILRGEPIPSGRYHQIIGVWTIHAHLARLLLTRRAFEKTICPGQWENTGGSILAGEEILIGAAREVREETGMPCQAEDLMPITRLKTECNFVDCFIYYTDIDPTGLVMQPQETIDYRWATLTELEGLIAAGTFAKPEIHQFYACRDALSNALAETGRHTNLRG